MRSAAFLMLLATLAIGALVGAVLWPYTINAWLVFFHKPPTVVWWHGGNHRIFANHRPCNSSSRICDVDSDDVFVVGGAMSTTWCTRCGGYGHSQANCPWIRHVRLAGR